jgi:hypothetical protein
MTLMSADEFHVRMDVLESRIAKIEVNQELVLQAVRQIGGQLAELVTRQFCNMERVSS